MPDQVPFDLAGNRIDLACGLLYPVLTQGLQAGVDPLLYHLDRARLGHCHQRHRAGLTAGPLGRSGDPLLNTSQVVGDAAHVWYQSGTGR